MVTVPQQLQRTDEVCLGCGFVHFYFVTHHDFVPVRLFHFSASFEGDSYSPLLSKGR